MHMQLMENFLRIAADGSASPRVPRRAEAFRLNCDHFYSLLDKLKRSYDPSCVRENYRGIPPIIYSS